MIRAFLTAARWQSCAITSGKTRGEGVGSHLGFLLKQEGQDWSSLAVDVELDGQEDVGEAVDGDSPGDISALDHLKARGGDK